MKLKCNYPQNKHNQQKFSTDTLRGSDSQQYSQRLEASLPADELRPGLVETTELAMHRLTFDDFLHADDERDLDLPRLLHTNHQQIHTVT